MVRFWQLQLGYPVRPRGTVRIGLDYRYRLRAGATLADLNMEAQGDQQADYFVLKCLGNPGAKRWVKKCGIYYRTRCQCRAQKPAWLR